MDHSSRYFSDFFILSVQVLVPNQGQELVPITVFDKNMFLLPVRQISNRHLALQFIKLTGPGLPEWIMDLLPQQGTLILFSVLVVISRAASEAAGAAK